MVCMCWTQSGFSEVGVNYRLLLNHKYMSSGIVWPGTIVIIGDSFGTRVRNVLFYP